MELATYAPYAAQASRLLAHYKSRNGVCTMARANLGVGPTVCRRSSRAGGRRWRCSGGCRPEAQRRPGVVDGNLPHRLDAVGGDGLSEPVAVEVGAELPAFGVTDPGDAVGGSGADNRAEPIEVVPVNGKPDHGGCGGRLGARRARGQGHARRGVDYCQRLARLNLQLLGEVHTVSVPRSVRRCSAELVRIPRSY